MKTGIKETCDSIKDHISAIGLEVNTLEQSFCDKGLTEDESNLISTMRNILYLSTIDRINKSSELSEKKNSISDSFQSINFINISEKVLHLCGFFNWDKEHKDYRLIPLWIFEFIPSGTELLSIDGKTVKMSPDLDNDIRFGCVAFMLKVR